MRLWPRRNPKKPARFALADREPRCARCWRDLTGRDSWLHKYVGRPDIRPDGPDDHYCRACRWRDGDLPLGHPHFAWVREWEAS